MCNQCSLGAANVIVWGATDYTHNDKYVCSDHSTNQPFPHLSPFLGPP